MAKPTPQSSNQLRPWLTWRNIGLAGLTGLASTTIAHQTFKATPAEYLEVPTKDGAIVKIEDPKKINRDICKELAVPYEVLESYGQNTKNSADVNLKLKPTDKEVHWSQTHREKEVHSSQKHRERVRGTPNSHQEKIENSTQVFFADESNPYRINIANWRQLKGKGTTKLPNVIGVQIGEDTETNNSSGKGKELHIIKDKAGGNNTATIFPFNFEDATNNENGITVESIKLWPLFPQSPDK